MHSGPSAPITFGTPRRDLDLRGVRLVESAYRPNLQIGPHSHDLPILVLVLDGTVSTRGSDAMATAGRDSVRAVRPGDVHSNSYGSQGARCFLVEVKPAMARQLGEYAGVIQAPLPDASQSRAALLLRQMYVEFFLGDAGAPLAIEGLLLELVATLVRSDPRRGAAPRWLIRVREAIDDGFQNDLRVEELSREAGVHPVQVARLFRSWYGCAPRQYLRSRRVEWAKSALQNTALPLSTIALKAGFADQSHLTREFRRAVGVTPGRYRALARG